MNKVFSRVPEINLESIDTIPITSLKQMLFLQVKSCFPIPPHRWITQQVTISLADSELFTSQQK